MQELDPRLRRGDDLFAVCRISSAADSRKITLRRVAAADFTPPVSP
jgi:hypothetical protein